MNNMDVFRQMNMPETVEVTAEEIKEAGDIKQDLMISEFIKQAPRSMKRKLMPKEKFGNKLMKAYQLKNKK